MLIIEEIFEEVPVYDITVKDNHNFYCGDVLVHNCTEIFQNTEPDKYLVKIYASKHDEDYITVDENSTVEIQNGIIKKGKNVSSLDTIYKIDNKSIPPFKVYCIEKKRLEGKTAVCNLASINLSKIYTKEDIERVVPIAINMLDNVIDLNFYPLKKVKNTNLQSRSIGLGVMGEAEFLASNQIMFGSERHLYAIDDIMEMVSYNAIKASSKLGALKGNYETFEGSNWNKGILPVDFANQSVLDLTFENDNVYSNEEWQELRDLASKNMRNGYLMAIAPTSSISILVGTTQTIEPVYKKKWYEENLSGMIPVVVPNLTTDTYEYYPSAYDVDQLELIKAAAVRQKWIDQGQSCNIFMRLDKASGKYLHDIYTLAWQLGLKSTYYLRGQSPESAKAVDAVDRSIECSSCQ